MAWVNKLLKHNCIILFLSSYLKHKLIYRSKNWLVNCGRQDFETKSTEILNNHRICFLPFRGKYIAVPIEFGNYEL